MVWQLICNQPIIGSNPIRSSIKTRKKIKAVLFALLTFIFGDMFIKVEFLVSPTPFRGVAKWLRHRILIPAFVGSNPTSPAKAHRIILNGLYIFL